MVDGQGFRFLVQQKSFWISLELPSLVPIFFRKNLGPDMRMGQKRNDPVEVVFGGQRHLYPADSATYTDPHTQTVESNRSVVHFSLVAEDTEFRILLSNQ